MKGILLTQYQQNLSDLLKSLLPVELPIPEITKDEEVLIKMDGSPCNPSDIAFMRGMYNIRKNLPKVAGFEGTGHVIATGSSERARMLLHKRVSCFTQADEHGTWAEYFKTSFKNCIPVNDQLSPEQAACFYVNPFTAYGLFETSINSGYKILVQNAAAGQVGRFIRIMAKEHKIKMINIVRRPQHVEILKKEGEEYVLNMRDKNFGEDLIKTFAGLDPCIALDAAGGEHSGHLLNTMPPGSTLMLYGGLSGKAASEFDILEMIFNRKTLKGFNLGDWIKTKTQEEKEEISGYLQHLIITKACETKIQRIVGLHEVQDGLYQYLTRMSDGKVIINPAINE